MKRRTSPSVVCRELNIEAKDPDMAEWTALVERIKNRKKKRFTSALWANIFSCTTPICRWPRPCATQAMLDTHIRIHWIDSENLSEQNIGEQLCGLDGIIVPGGFGNRGIEGMILSAKYARETGLPYFGFVSGMQIAVMEYARNVCGIADANSGEFDELCKNKVIDFMPGQSNDIDKGGTLDSAAIPAT